MSRPDLLDKLLITAESLLEDSRILFYLFRREKVFLYFLFLILLMFAAGAGFLFLEYDHLVAAHPGPHVSWTTKIISSLYWAIVTISTCGYGDLAPVTSAGRLLVIVTLYISVAAVALFTANLTSALTTKKMMERRGVMDLTHFKNHFILCGWKQSMDKLLGEIVFNNPRIDLRKLIIIANIEPDLIEVFRQQFPAYQHVPILRGEHYNETLLRKANADKAIRIFILADESNPAASPTEVDSKTIMTAMTLRTLSRDVRICAELLDVQFEKYLHTAHVEDIIFTSEYSKVLIANSVTQTGVAKVVNDLLNAHTPAFITTEAVPAPFALRPFGELREFFHKEQHAILIGLVENVGSLVARKREAIRAAQKTADINRLVANLQNAKHLENNRPNLNPEDSYPVPADALAVLVRRRDV